ncbi:uncharacterized protein LOC134840074 [Symsagittifera roscoffensis]|uniref:uncharacterized protein LOC134840074 n=1 Tax=Symsagittifera roscoffensis TaxID=84072 RepID=UPI00307CA775
MATYEEKFEHNQHCEAFICCQKCDFHATTFDSDGHPEFVIEDEGYLWCPNNHRLFRSFCEVCAGTYTHFYRNRNRVLCVSCDYPVFIFKLPLLDHFDFLDYKFDLTVLEREICCERHNCSNSSLREFQIIPIDDKILSLTCHKCDLEQIIVPTDQQEKDCGTANDFYQGGGCSRDEMDLRKNWDAPQKYPGGALEIVQNGAKTGFFSKLKAVTMPVFRTLFNIGRRTFKPVAKLALSAAAPILGPLGTTVGLTLVEIAGHLLEQFAQEKDDGDKKPIQEIMKELLPFLEDHVVEQVLKILGKKSVAKGIKDR